MSEIRSSWRRTRSEEDMGRKRPRSGERGERRPRERERNLSAHRYERLFSSTRDGEGKERRRVEGFRRDVSPIYLRDRRRSPSPSPRGRGEVGRGGRQERRGRESSYGER